MGALTRFFRSSWGVSLLYLIAFNILVRLVATVGYPLLPEHYAPLSFIAPLLRSKFIFWSFANFDGEHYLSIAAYGYHVRNGFPQYAFFPLYPLLIKAVSLVVRDYLVAALIVSQGSLWVALTVLGKWSKIIKRTYAPWFLLIAPGAIFLASAYTESVFLALAVLTFYFAERGWWGRAALAVALATATRVNGLLLVIFLAIKFWQHRVSLLRLAGRLLIATSGILAYMGYLWSKTGDPLAWYHAQAAWGKETATSPVTTALSYFRAISVDFHPDLTHLVVIFEVVVTLTALALFLYAAKKKLFDLSYLVYLAGNLVLPLATGSLGSMPRFYLTLFPLYAVVPLLPKTPRTMYYGVSIGIAAIGIVLFTRGWWFG